jgi:hypothetical protein
MSADISLDRLRRMMAAQGVKQLLVKELAANDTSKNQPYLGNSLEILNILPMGEVREETTADGNQGLKAPLPLSWLRDDGRVLEAPQAQLILYPQYPEIRMSGFLKGMPRVDDGPNALMTRREAGRVLLFGLTPDRRIIARVAAARSLLADDIRALGELPATGVFRHVPLGAADTSRERLLQKLREIHGLGWLASERLYPGGTIGPCNGSNCGGYTLEAHLGIVPNGRAEPDFEGWEIKGHAVADFVRYSSGPLTLMTPEPTGGYYRDEGAAAFVRKYGYADRLGRADRLNFGGVHRIGQRQPLTGLTLTFLGYTPGERKFEAGGGFSLIDADGAEAATWRFASLIAHWNRKHAKAAYVPYRARTSPARAYAYGGRVRLGEDTDFLRFLAALAGGQVYYDPGIKLEGASTTRPQLKRRSQFRIQSANLMHLYSSMTTVDTVP